MLFRSSGPGTFTLSGQAAALRADRALAMACGAFTMTGQDAALSRTRVLQSAAGSFTISGQETALVYRQKQHLRISGAVSYSTIAAGAAL